MIFNKKKPAEVVYPNKIILGYNEAGNLSVTVDSMTAAIRRLAEDFYVEGYTSVSSLINDFANNLELNALRAEKEKGNE